MHATYQFMDYTKNFVTCEVIVKSVIFSEKWIDYCIEYPDESEGEVHDWSLTIPVGSHVLYKTQPRQSKKAIIKSIDRNGIGSHTYSIFTQYGDDIKDEPLEISFNTSQRKWPRQNERQCLVQNEHAQLISINQLLSYIEAQCIKGKHCRREVWCNQSVCVSTKQCHNCTMFHRQPQRLCRFQACAPYS